MATMSMLGALLGFGLFGFNAVHTGHAYWIYCGVIVLTVSLTCVVAKERARVEAPVFAISELVGAYSIDVVAHSDFFWVFVTRAFYYMSISLQAFLLFMLRDVQQVSDHAPIRPRATAAVHFAELGPHVRVYPGRGPEACHVSAGND